MVVKYWDRDLDIGQTSNVKEDETNISSTTVRKGLN